MFLLINQPLPSTLATDIPEMPLDRLLEQSEHEQLSSQEVSLVASNLSPAVVANDDLRM